MGHQQQLLERFRGKFYNISRIMDCVGCQRCRLWGKLQIMCVRWTFLCVEVFDADDHDDDGDEDDDDDVVVAAAAAGAAGAADAVICSC